MGEVAFGRYRLIAVIGAGARADPEHAGSAAPARPPRYGFRTRPW
jgi:hypothetical protein